MTLTGPWGQKPPFPDLSLISRTDVLIGYGPNTLEKEIVVSPPPGGGIDGKLNCSLRVWASEATCALLGLRGGRVSETSS